MKTVSIVMKMKRLLALLVLPALAFGAVTTTVTPGSWDLYRGTSKIQGYTSEAACVVAAKALNVSRRYYCKTSETVDVAVTADPVPTCTTPKPADLSQIQACPAGTTGSWTQTATYSAAPYPTCWIAGAYSPTSAPAGACTTLTTVGPTFTLSTYAYSGDGYANASWSGVAPCSASAVPAYAPWSGALAASDSKSVSPDVTTVLTLTCANGSVSRTLTVTNGTPTTGGGGTDPTPTPITGTPYSGYTYTLPTVRPFLSLKPYAGSVGTAAYTRLKAQVDDAVTVTAATSGNYDALVTALNSNHYGYSVVDSLVMFSLTTDSKYLQQAIKMVDLFITSENAKIASGTVPAIAGDSYLEVGQLLEQVALTYDYGYSLLSVAQRAAWATYADQTIYNVWNYGSAKWGSKASPWSGWSVNDPGNNYFYSFLRAAQLWAWASQNTTQLSFLQAQKYTLLVPFFSNLVGGGSREGTGYGTALMNLFEDYAYWKSSTGEDLSALSSHARDTMDYWVHATVPTFDYYASIGDQARSSMPLMFDYQRKLMEEAVALAPTSAQAARGTWWLNRIKVTDGGSGSLTGQMRYNYDFRYDLLARAATEQAPTALVYDTPGVGALFARSDWSTSASWFHTNAGYFDQSHAHQDQGGFSFYKGGWLTVTSNIYSNSGINQDVGTENVIRFVSGGAVIPQKQSVSTKTVSDSPDVLLVSENLSPAYAGSAVSSWTREFTYTRSAHTLVIRDRCTVGSGVTSIFQLHLPIAPTRQSDGSYVAGKLKITAPVVGTVVDMRTVSSDYKGGYRLEFSGGCDSVVTLQAM